MEIEAFYTRFQDALDDEFTPAANGLHASAKMADTARSSYLSGFMDGLTAADKCAKEIYNKMVITVESAPEEKQDDRALV